MADNKSIQQQHYMSTQIPTNHFFSENEISLIDLIQVMLRRKLLLISVLLIGTALAVTAAILHEQKYLYSAAIEIGSIADTSGRFSLVEPVNTVRDKLDESIIPAVLAEYSEANKSVPFQSFSARTPRRSELVLLEAKGFKVDETAIVTIANNVMARLNQDQAPLFELEKSTVVNQLLEKERLLAEEKSQHKSLLAAVERTTKLGALRTQQLKEAKARLERLKANRAKLPKDNNATLTHLLVDSEIEKAQRLQIELEQDVNFDLPARNDELERQITHSIHRQASIEADIANVKLRLENIRETHFVTEPGVNPVATGVSNKAIIAVGIVLSAMLAIMAVFLAEFVSRVRQEMAENGAG